MIFPLTAASSKDHEAMLEAGKCFHRVLIHSTRNGRLIDLLDNLNDQMDRIRSFFYFDLSVAYIDQAFQEHIGIIEAIKARDTKSAEEIMRIHIRRYWERLKELVWSKSSNLVNL